MITRNAMQLKAFIKKKAQEYNVSAQLVMQNYMLERLLERISLSKYKHNFVIKGGIFNIVYPRIEHKSYYGFRYHNKRLNFVT